MADPNEEFEAFLRQFRLREIRPLSDAASPRSGWTARWTIAAAAALFAVVISFAAAQRVMRRESVTTPPRAETPTAAKESAPAPPPPVQVVREPQVKAPPAPTKPSVAVQQPPAEPPASPPAGDPPPNSREDDEGKATLQHVCGACHSTDVVTNLHFSTRQEYADVISGEKAKGFGVSYSDKDFQSLVDYLFNTYGDKSAPARKKK